MPIFDYRCNDCRTVYDIFHKGKEIVEEIQCPKCNSREYTKLLSVVSISTKNTSTNMCDSAGCGLDKSYCQKMCGVN